MGAVLIECPEEECVQPAEIVDDWMQETTNGPIIMTKTHCVNGHIVDQWREAPLP